jgi:rhodanese-related sulfurtransferase
MGVPQISPEELAQRLAGPKEQQPVLVDVRGPSEHARASLPGSLLIPLPELEERIDELEALKDRPLVVYCHMGVRSLNAVLFLASQGISAVSLAGGIDRWSTSVDPSVPRY